MSILNTIFTAYDSLFSQFSDKAQILVAALLIALLVSSIFFMIKHGHWIFLLVFVILFPGGPQALKILFLAFWTVLKFLSVRLLINL